MTALERLILANIFDAEDDNDDTLYLSAATYPCEFLTLNAGELKAAVAASVDIDSQISLTVAVAVPDLSGLDDDIDIDLDLTTTSYEGIFQDIVRRSSSLRQISVIASFTCSKMRPDGFGGLAVLITPDKVWSKSTDEMLAEFLTEAEFGTMGVAPGFGVHTLAALSEADVMAQVPAIIEADPGLEISLGDVLPGDVREACVSVTASADLVEEKGFAVYKAALLAIVAAKAVHQGVKGRASLEIDGVVGHAPA